MIRMNSQPESDPHDEGSEVPLDAMIEALRPALKGYVLSLLPDRDACEDVVQETCLFLWERRTDFVPGTNFKSWAFKTAWFMTLTHRRDMQRRKLVSFSEDVLERISRMSESFADQADPRLDALRHCIADLPADSKRLLRLKYLDRSSLTDHAKDLGVKPNQIQKSLSRIRLILRHCIGNRLSSAHE